ncbi:cell wall protein [Streptomyces sp. CMSTAAHL-2]|uniref:cell wall protein n=1 Tax=Streptomyces TaxID=1883 RepID=UPI001E2D9A87|nr:cell wall protein [Streptomyces sp. CMSTAAHL-2]MCE3034874.1 cell wall protein [Streptomyces sp. CMSTAAHL-2]
MTGRHGIDRRSLLTSAALGGATIVGASALGGLDADAAFAAPMPSLDPAVSRSSFIDGRVSRIKGSTLDVVESDGSHRLVQLTNATSVWKLETVTAEAIETGDGLYARGVEMPDGSVAADAVWVNIVNLYVTVRGIERSRLHLSHGRNALVGHIVAKRTTASFRGGALTSDLSQLKIGHHAQVLGAWRPADDSVDIARISVGH